MTDQEYEQQICEVPHLNLTSFLPVVPVQQILIELEQNLQHVSKFEYSRKVDPRRMEYVRESWQGFSLVDITSIGAHMIDYYTTNLTHSRTKELGVQTDDRGFAIFKITDVGQAMPITTAYTTSLFNDLCRIRISKLTAGMQIPYHCHLQKARQNPDKIVPDESYRATIHIPLITNDGCSFSVTENTGQFDGHPDDFKLPINQLEHQQHYKVGEVWMFNSVHYHKAVNLGKQDRYHLLIYFDYMDPTIRAVIESALISYTGARISSK